MVPRTWILAWTLCLVFGWAIHADSNDDPNAHDEPDLIEPSRWMHPEDLPPPEPSLPPEPPPRRIRRVDVPEKPKVREEFDSLEMPEPLPSLRGRLALIVADDLYASISNRLNRHALYLQLDGYDVVLYQFAGSAQDLRAHLSILHAEPASLVGAKLIGNIPWVLFQAGSQSYICDLFFMDLDGIWTDTNNNGRYNSWTGNKSLEIWVSRLKTDNLPSLGTEFEVMHNYFDKNHAYRSGALRPQARGLAYIYKDWPTLLPKDAGNLQLVYGEENTTFTGSTSASDYKNNRLPADQEFMITRTHGYSGGHHYGGWIYSADYREILPPTLFYQLGSCNVADFTVEDYVVGTMVFNDYPAGLFVWGLSQTGMMYDEEPFYTRLADGHSLGTAFRAWFETVKDYSAGPSYFYGSLLMGDASLRPSPSFPPIHTIAGHVRTTDGTGIGGVMLMGLPGNPVTDDDGYYEVLVSHEWSGSVTPMVEGYTFDPPDRTYDGFAENSEGEDYVGTPEAVTLPDLVWISGHVRNGHGTGISEVTLDGLPGAPITGNDGFYHAPVPYGWSGTVTPRKHGLKFVPASRVHGPVEEHLYGQDHAGAWKHYTVSGHVRTPGGQGVPGVIMDGLPGDPVTDHEGRYSAFVPFGWTCTVRPMKDGFRFAPRTHRHVQVIGALAARDHTVRFASWGAGDSSRLEPLAGLTDVVRLAVGWGHTLVLRPDGRVAAWGGEHTDSDHGQSIVPPGLSNVVNVAAGNFHSLAVRANGTVVAWGAGGPGQNNWNDRGQSIVPAGLGNVIAAAAGSHHSLALKADGTVVAWGAGGPGQDGFPHYGQSIVPATATNVIAIAADGYHSLALRANGTVVAWGRNDYGQTSVPAGLTSAVAVAAGANHSVALRADGTVMAWGAGGPGQGGGLHHGQSTVPPGLNQVRAVAAGSSHTLALRTDGTVTAWGYDGFGASTIPSGLNNAVLVDSGNAFNMVAIGIVESPAPAWGAPIPETPPPHIQTALGQTVFLRTHAVGHLPITYTWYRNGEPVPGANGAVLTLEAIQPDEVGFYECIVANASGVVTTKTIAVYMITTRGVPTDWYQTHGLVPGVGQAWCDLDELDSDGDGMTNWMEHRAGTDPMNAACCLTVHPIRDVSPSDSFPIRWPSVAGRRYRVLRATNLTDGIWQTVATGIEADPPENEFRDTPVSGDGPWYYRIRLE